MSKIKEAHIQKLKERNLKCQEKFWPQESDDYYAKLAETTFTKGVSENTYEQKVIIGKAVENCSIYDISLDL